MTNHVVAALIWRDGWLLACQRLLSGRFPGKWEFPGGKVEPGELPEPALQRELAEELGIDAAIGERIWRTQHQYPGFNPVELDFYEVREYSGEVKNLAFEQIRWLKPAELVGMDFLEADLPLVQKLTNES